MHAGAHPGQSSASELSSLHGNWCVPHFRLACEGRTMAPHYTGPVEVTPLFSHQMGPTRVDLCPCQGPAESGGEEAAPG